MDARSRRTLNALLDGTLPPGYSTETFHDFINFTPPGKTTGCCVVRVVGKGRHLVLFKHPADPFRRNWSSPPSELYYLNSHGELIPFDARSVVREHNEGRNSKHGWERAVGEWLAPRALGFSGRGWSEACARRVRNLVARWAKHYSGCPHLTRKEGS